jgi:hypothetical protein
MEHRVKALFALCLFRVQILVRLGKQFFDSFAIATIKGDADTRGETRGLIVAGEDLADAIGNAPGIAFL